MSGRHRKPTTSSFSVAKIAVTGAVIGGGAVGLTAQAHAATDSEWDVVASCESSGNWAINTGNGYQGGLQFSPSTWMSYGGGQFASAANLASRDQQIAIAEKVLAGQGRGAWPVCGRGLSAPTPRDVSVKAAKAPAPAQTPAAAAATPATDVPATVAPLDNPLPEVPLVPQDAPAPQDLAPGDDAPAVVPAAPEAPAQGVPAPAAPAPAQAPAQTPKTDEQVAPQPQIISISETIESPDSVIVETSLIGPAPLDPADPAVPPVTATTPVPVPPVTATGDAVVASAPIEGVSHLPSPASPPPGTSTDPGAAAANPNVSYLKDLWHAVQNKEIDRNDLLLALAQRSFTGAIPADNATPAPVDAPAPPAT